MMHFFSQIKKNLTKKSFFEENNRNIYIDNFSISNDNNYMHKSYKNNVIVNRCVNLISQSAAHVPFIIYTRTAGKLAQNHTHHINKLLHKPNQYLAGSAFFEKVIANKLLFGNSYILATGLKNNHIYELFTLPSSNIQIISDEYIIRGYKYVTNKKTYEYPVDPKEGKSQILHLKNYNPYSEIYGLSNVEAASAHIELHNQATRWNNALLKNGARPSGALIVKGENNFLSDEQFVRLKEQLLEKYSGSTNSGKPLLLEGGLDWKEMSMNPKDMDFIESKSSAAREIALSFGVPPQLLGIAGDNTYSNMQEARLALWEETLMPLLDNLTDALSNWFSILLSEEIKVDFDKDAISALSERRQNVWAKIASADFMTINEKRNIVGLDPIKGGNQLQNKPVA